MTLLTLFSVLACSSSGPKGEIANSADPGQEIAQIEQDLQAARLQNVDVLAQTEFDKSYSHLDEARDDLKDNAKRGEILSELRLSRGQLQAATAVADKRRGAFPGLFEARQAAMAAGAGNYPSTKKEFRRIDLDVSKNADNLGRVSAQDIAKIQNAYVTLERDATIATQLSGAQSIIEDVRGDKTHRRASNTFKNAEAALANAKSVVSTNVRNPAGYEKAVKTANDEATLLQEVAKHLREDKKLSEASALQLVGQRRQIANLQGDLKRSETAGAEAQADLNQENQSLTTELEGKNRALSTAAASVQVQQKIEEARKRFSADEAEAYQQGDSLLIRLKQVNFASGRSDLPASSLGVLAKVSEIAKELNASEIKVEGHTDSTGSIANNKTISQARANAVATYFKSNGFDNIDVESEGYGFEKPIATNKSQQGRAQNRRVDIVITPAMTKFQ